MNFFPIIIIIFTTAVSANFQFYSHIVRIAGEIPGHGGHVFGSNQISKCDKLRYKLMMKNRHRPDVVRRIYNLELDC